tara:strand:- start:6770 stop:7237 length:468 start_codon:yes stop_codon:yes gene_type:complete
MQIILNHLEAQIAVQMGTARMLQNQKNGVISRGPRKLEPDINGAGGEIAVCKYFNRYPDTTIGPHFSGYDLKVKGNRVDVKTTSYDPGYLQAKIKKDPKDCDVFVLVHVSFPVFTILGGASSSQLLQDINIQDMGYGAKYVMEQSQLNSMEQLFA